MLISQAYAATTDAATGAQIDALNGAPTFSDALMSNLGLILLMVVMFYFLLIRPQQRRFKEHAAMLSELKKGDRVVTSSGMIGKIDTIVNDQEAIIDLGNGTKITFLRSMIQGKADDLLKKPAPLKAEEKKK